MDMYCPLSKCHGTVDPLICIYRCKVGRKIKCVEYTRQYPELSKLVIEIKYVEKYGEAEFPLPISMRKRRKRKT